MTNETKELNLSKKELKDAMKKNLNVLLDMIKEIKDEDKDESNSAILFMMGREVEVGKSKLRVFGKESLLAEFIVGMMEENEKFDELLIKAVMTRIIHMAGSKNTPPERKEKVKAILSAVREAAVEILSGGVDNEVID